MATEEKTKEEPWKEYCDKYLNAWCKKQEAEIDAWCKKYEKDAAKHRKKQDTEWAALIRELEERTRQENEFRKAMMQNMERLLAKV
jgi:hypothetical protein